MLVIRRREGEEIYQRDHQDSRIEGGPGLLSDWNRSSIV